MMFSWVYVVPPKVNGNPMSMGAVIESSPIVSPKAVQSVGLLQMVDTPSQVADQMEDYFDQVGGDGFMLSPIYSPGAIEEFVDLVVPELQRRGRYRRDYAGTTQRDHLMQEE